MIKPFLQGAMISLVSLYVGAGLFAGLLMEKSIPALNWFGVTYITATWPAVLYCAPTIADCDPYPSDGIAEYMFTFTITSEAQQ